MFVLHDIRPNTIFMTEKNIFVIAGAVVALGAAAFLLFFNASSEAILDQDMSAAPRTMTLSGTYECLPHKDTSGPQTMECAFGLRADDGKYYAVDFGSSADSMDRFQSGARITAEGFFVAKELLSTDHWQKYNMEGIFTVERLIDPTPTMQGKINVDAVCEGALAYMSFPDGESAATFVAECKDGKHPEVIEQYKADMNLGDGAMI